MDCKQFDDVLMDYLYNELHHDALSQVELHLKTCPRCTSLLSSYQHTRQVMEDLPLLDPSPSLDHEILKAARQFQQANNENSSPQKGWGKSIRMAWFSGWLRPTLAGVTSLSVILGVSLYIYQRSTPPSLSPTLDTPQLEERPFAPSTASAPEPKTQDEPKLSVRHKRSLTTHSKPLVPSEERDHLSGRGAVRSRKPK